MPHTEYVLFSELEMVECETSQERLVSNSRGRQPRSGWIEAQVTQHSVTLARPHRTFAATAPSPEPIPEAVTSGRSRLTW
jgi:hypothetical protein